MPAQKRPSAPSPSAAAGAGSPPPASSPPPPAAESAEKKPKREENGAEANGNANGERAPRPAPPSPLADGVLPPRSRRADAGFPLVPVVFVVPVVTDSGAKAAAAAASEASESESEDADAVNQEYVLARPSAHHPRCLPFAVFFPFTVARRRRRSLPDACSRCGAAKWRLARAFASLSLARSPALERESPPFFLCLVDHGWPRSFWCLAGRGEAPSS